MNEKQKNIVMSITDEIIQLYQNLLFDDDTSKNVGNMYFEMVASILSSINVTITNGFAKDVSDNNIEYKEALIEVSKTIIREIMTSTERLIQQSEMH
jgi:hypothetical protein